MHIFSRAPPFPPSYFSPLTPLFRKFALVSLENELFAKLTHRWFGNGVPPPETARTIVSFSHVLPAFLIIGTLDKIIVYFDDSKL